jgi:hypothetical protein
MVSQEARLGYEPASGDNVKFNHNQQIGDLFRHSPQSDSLGWHYRERTPDGFARWTTEQISYLSDDPLSRPSLRFGGLNSGY